MRSRSASRRSKNVSLWNQNTMNKMGITRHYPRRSMRRYKSHNNMWNQNTSNNLGIPPRSYTRRNKSRYARFIHL